MDADGEKQQEGEIIEIRKSILIEAGPEVVFTAITDPNELTKWFPDQAIFEPRVGLLNSGYAAVTSMANN
jgi:uncharacterized protein YndB with AHSA1/START domain